MAAVGLQFFLLPNQMIDGGVTGLSIIAARLTGLPLGLYLFLLNLPFLYFGYTKIGKSFAAYSALGIVSLAILSSVHISSGFTHVPILAAIFGGIVIGVGVGLVVRYGGIIDGMDMIAVIIGRATIFSVGEAILVINGLIITLAGFVFGWEQALYSLIAYFVVHKAVDITIEGLDESRTVWIVTMHARSIGKAINELIKEPVTYIRESDPDAREPHGVVLVVITRLQEQKVMSAIRAIDPMAYIVITAAHEVIGKLSEGTLYRER